MFEVEPLRGRGRPKNPDSKIQRAIRTIRRRPVTPRELSIELECSHKYAIRIVEILIDRGYASRTELRRKETPRWRERLIAPAYLYRYG